jgi:hypothetical protein
MTLAAMTTGDAGAMVTSSRLLVTRRDSATRSYQALGFLELRDQTYTFAYLRTALADERFRTLPGLSDTARRYSSDRLFPVFAERVISARRPDRQVSMAALGLSQDAALFEVLQRSGGRRVGDTIEVLPAPTAGPNGELTIDFLVHGVRYQSSVAQDRISRLEVGERLRIVAEPDNEWNTRTLLVTDSDEVQLGYVPDPLLDVLHSADVHSVTVVRANGPEVGFHFRLLVRVNMFVPAGSQPFGGPEWNTVA